MKRLRALGWVGGKSVFGSHGTGRWIAGLLPPPGATHTYIEPFCGMLGVLLQREPARREIVSDLDGNLINWWEIVRDRPAELGDMLDFTPGWSAALFGEACQNLDHPDPLRRAYYFTCAVHWVRGNMIGRVRVAQKSVQDDDGLRRSVTARQERWDETSRAPAEVAPIMRMPVSFNEKWGNRETAQLQEAQDRAAYNSIRRSKVERGAGDNGIRRSKAERGAADGIRRASVTRHQTDADGNVVGRPDTPQKGRRAKGELSPPRSPHIMALHDRIREIELEHWPAEKIMEFYAENPNITFYLDPPYPSATGGLYSFNDIDTDRWVSLLAETKGLAAISGYGNEWKPLEDLGWRRHEHDTIASVASMAGKPRSKRTEVLWTNYDPAEYDPEPGLFG